MQTKGDEMLRWKIITNDGGGVHGKHWWWAGEHAITRQEAEALQYKTPAEALANRAEIVRFMIGTIYGEGLNRWEMTLEGVDE